MKLNTAIALGLIFAATSDSMASPPTLAYEGTLQDSAGLPASSGEYPMSFRIYDSRVDGTELWSQSQTVTVDLGQFTVVLDLQSDPTPLAALSEATQWWFAVEVDGEVLGQRQRLHALPGIDAKTVEARLELLEGQVEALADDLVTLEAAFTSRECPVGYERYDDPDDPGGEGAWVVCRRPVIDVGGIEVRRDALNAPLQWGGGGTEPVWDEVVRVGNFWIDRYELSNCTRDGVCGAGANNGSGEACDGFPRMQGVGCSVAEITPASGITWFEANQLCTNAGKRLCTNAEWQTAVTGTPDPAESWPDDNPANGCSGDNSPGSTRQCNTCSGGVRVAGNRRSAAAFTCISQYGAFDMIGNVEEWTADWVAAGPSQVSGATIDATAATWGPFSTDGFRGVDGQVSAQGGLRAGLPTAIRRGGGYESGVESGRYSGEMTAAPSADFSGTGARCCLDY